MSVATGCVAVIRLVGCFAAIYAREEETYFISQKPEELWDTAYSSARTFALKNKITLIHNCQTLPQPVMTVFKQGTFWYPAQIHPDWLIIIDEFQDPFDSSQKAKISLDYEGAISVAKTMAFVKKWDFVL